MRRQHTKQSSPRRPAKTSLDPILDFCAELGQLKRVRRSGWWTIGITHGESVADHSFRCAVIGYVLALMEGVEPYRTCVMCLFNDLHEARINDLHKVVHRYINVRNAEKTAFAEQIAPLPRFLREPFAAHLNELWNDTTPESVVARDADILECMLQGKEYYEQGFRQAREFFVSSMHLLKTNSARLLARRLRRWNTQRWCTNLALLER